MLAAVSLAAPAAASSRQPLEPVDQVIAVTRLSRTVSQNGPVITLVSDFKRLAPELAADAARSAEAPLDAMSRDYAYVVSKKKLKLTE